MSERSMPIRDRILTMNLDIFEQKVATARRMMYQGVQDMSAESWEFISQTRELTGAIQGELLSRAEGAWRLQGRVFDNIRIGSGNFYTPIDFSTVSITDAAQVSDGIAAQRVRKTFISRQLFPASAADIASIVPAEGTEEQVRHTIFITDSPNAELAEVELNGRTVLTGGYADFCSGLIAPQQDDDKGFVGKWAADSGALSDAVKAFVAANGYYADVKSRKVSESEFRRFH